MIFASPHPSEPGGLSPTGGLSSSPKHIKNLRPILWAAEMGQGTKSLVGSRGETPGHSTMFVVMKSTP